MLSRFVEPFLRPFDNEGNELIVRWRLWKARWLPYRMAEFLGYDEETLEMQLGPWVWYAPRVLKGRLGWRYRNRRR